MKSKKRTGNKTLSIVALCICLVLTVLCGALGMKGMPLDSRGLYKLLPWLPGTTAETWPQSLSLGLDLRGGVYVEYTCDLPEGSQLNYETALELTMSAMRQRLDDKGLSEATVQRNGNSGIRVEVPDVENPDDVLSLIGTPAQLSFVDPNGEVFMTGAEVVAAQYSYDNGAHNVAFTLNADGARVFAEKTAANIGRQIAIVMDRGTENEKTLVNATVQNAITGGSGVITGQNSAESAQTLAAQIQSGALPMNVRQDKVDKVSATLGADALTSAVKAAIIGILLVMLVMILRYRLNGVIASWALCIYIIALFWLLAIAKVQLTLPGLAGIVLGIGMAVDANVIIYERFNEEIRTGKLLKHAVRSGFKNALSAILDGNITTLIAAIVLLVYGTGAIQGFAKTLLLSVLVSMVSAILVTRFLMIHVVNLAGQKPALFASNSNKEVQAE